MSAAYEGACRRTARPGGLVAGLAALLLAEVAALLLAGAARAQVTEEYELPDLEEPPGILDRAKTRLTLANRFIGVSDFGSYDTVSNQPEARLRVELPVSDETVLRVLGTGRVIVTEFEGASNLFGTGLSGGDPFDNLNAWTVRFQAGRLLPERWTLFSERERWAVLFQGAAKARYEAGSSVWDGLKGDGSVGVFYRLPGRLEVAAGLQVGSKLFANGVSVSPFLEFDWRLDGDWRLKSYGLGLQLERRLGEELWLFTRGRLEGGSYRLADRGGAIGKGAVKLRQLPVGLGLRWRPWGNVRITAVGGAVLLGRLEVEDEDRDRLGRDSADPAGYFTLRIDLAPPD